MKNNVIELECLARWNGNTDVNSGLKSVKHDYFVKEKERYREIDSVNQVIGNIFDIPMWFLSVTNQWENVIRKYLYILCNKWRET